MKTFSKTDFVNGCQCRKLLWLTKHNPDACERTDNLKTKQGQEVGELARKLFPGAVTVPLAKAYQMAAETEVLIAEGRTAICEATFIAGGLSCSADIVLFYPDGVDVIEVKSSTDTKDVQLTDMTFQYHVITTAGYHVKSMKIMHLNGEYRRGDGDLDLEALFVMEDRTADILCRVSSVEETLEELQALCLVNEEPATCLGIQCDKPHECPCKAYCFQKIGIPEESVFAIAGMPAKKKYQLFASGICTPDKLLTTEGALSAKQREQVLAWTMPDDGEIKVDKKRVKEFLSTIRYPLYHLDFETFQSAIPRFYMTKPYQQIPFQYSIHVQESAGAEPTHYEFLAEAGKDPRRALAEALCSTIPLGAQSIAYNYSFEKAVCRHLAEIFPDLEAHLLDICSNMLDLMIPFQKKWVYTKAMHGSYSIKAVLPALCGDDPELDYHKLPVVHNGAEASETFAFLHEITDLKTVETIRTGLLMYCGLDTLAMVKVLNVLYQLTA